MCSLFVLFTTVNAQENLTYQKPSAEIMQLFDYEKAPGVLMDEKKEYMIFTWQNTYKTLDDLNQDELQLGGLRINPVTNIASAMTYFNNLKVRKTTGQNPVQVQGLPSNPRIANLSWSPDDKKLAFTNTTDHA